jgi:uncharacterized protein (TIGR02147 family)
MSITIWNYKDYKKYLKAVTESARPQRGVILRLATGAGCQPSYLSQVLAREVQLTPDHAFSLAEHLGLAPDERKYFCLMVDLARAASPKLRADLDRQLNEIRDANTDVGKRIEREKRLPEIHQALYYSTWLLGAAHILTAIPEYQTLSAAARRLQVSEPVMVEVFQRLVEMGLVTKDGSRWKYSRGEFHLPKDSPLIALHHQNWRARAVLDAQSSAGHGLHFSGAYAVGRDDLERLKQVFLDALKVANKIAGPAASEELVCIACDVFRV